MSDPHFGHKNILGFSRSEFTNVEEHDNYLVDRINDTVHATKDKLFILGDIAFSSHHFMLCAINCQNIVIIGGNHDYPKKIKNMLKLRKDLNFAGAFDLTLKGHKPWILTHIPVHPSQLEFRYSHNIHGHLHQFYIDDSRYINVSMEHLDNYCPISQDQLVEKITSQTT